MILELKFMILRFIVLMQIKNMLTYWNARCVGSSLVHYL